MRLEGYDYSLEGMYFITICTHRRVNYFENNAAVEMVYNIWNLAPERNHGLPSENLS